MIAALIRLVGAVLVASFAASGAAGSEVRLKDLVEFDGVRGNDLVGYGLVVGLNGTGDGLRNSPFTEEILSNILERLGVNVAGEQFRPKNVAAVFVTGELPPFARGGRPDRRHRFRHRRCRKPAGRHAYHDAAQCRRWPDLCGGQGTIIAGGVRRGRRRHVVQGVPTSGVIPAGARIEREMEFDFTSLPPFALLCGAGFHHRRADRIRDQRALRAGVADDAGFRHGPA